MTESGRPVMPFTAIVGMEKLKLALVLNGVNPRIGGVLVSGPKGTGKTTVVRALADLLPEVEMAEGCRFGCDPSSELLCPECRKRNEQGEKLSGLRKKMRVVNLPLSATEDRLIGALDLERVLKDGIQALKPGILAEANQNILYVDEVNLLPDHLVDDLLDAAATKVNVIEREGVSISHPSDFVLVGTMNPEEGELRPQLLDRFPLHVEAGAGLSVDQRMELVRRNLAFERNPTAFREQWAEEQFRLMERIVTARELLDQVTLPDAGLRAIAMACDALEVDGVRPDIIISKTAVTNAAFDGRKEVSLDDMKLAAQLALSHRTRRGGLLEPPSSEEIDRAITRAADVARREDKRASPYEAPPEPGQKSEKRAKGMFGRQAGIPKAGSDDVKKKLRGT